MSGFLFDLAILVWAAISLFIALVAAAISGKKGFLWAFIVMWGVIPLGLVIHGNITKFQNERLMAKLREEYRTLCAAPDRQVIKRTVQNVEDVSVWPAKGPRDAWGNDLFFQARKAADEWIRGRNGGRYGGFRRALVMSPESKAVDTPRYQVVFKELRAGIVNGRPFIHGADIKILDKSSNELLAERKDYIGQTNFGFPHGCDSTHRGISDEWFHDNLAFIHSVLNPPLGVRVIQKELPSIFEKPLAEAVPKTISATVLREMTASALNAFVPIERTLPENVRYEATYRSTATELTMTDHVIIFMYEDHDVSLLQGLGLQSTLLAFSPDDKDYAALFWIENHEYLLLRRFSSNGALIDQAKVQLPSSLGHVAFLNSANKMLIIEPLRYRVRVSLNPRKGQFERDVELAFDRSPQETPR